MLIHIHKDGSKGYEFEIGDAVIVNSTIAGGWFDLGPVSSKCCTIVKIDKRNSWRIAKLSIHYSNDWGLCECFPWMVEPTQKTIESATYNHVKV